MVVFEIAKSGLGYHDFHSRLENSFKIKEGKKKCTEERVVHAE
jgi:hypothetical protein